MTPVRDSRKRGTTGLDTRKAGIGPRTGPSYNITGRTLTNGNTPIPLCDVLLYRTIDGVLIDTTQSDLSGNFSFTVSDNTTEHYLVATKTGFNNALSANNIVGGMTVDLVLIAIAQGAGERWRDYEEYLKRERQQEEDELILLICQAFVTMEESCELSRVA